MELNVIQSKIAQLRKSERESKDLIADLAIATVVRIHEHNDVTSVNSFIVALSPLNQKKVQSFVEKFSGHKIAEGVVGGRRKDYKKGTETVSPYNDALIAFKQFVATGMDFWQWCVMENAAKPAKVVDLAALQKAAGKLHKMLGQAQAAGIIDTVGSLQLLLGQSPMTQDELMAGLGAVFAAKKAIDKAEDAAMDEALNKAAA